MNKMFSSLAEAEAAFDVLYRECHDTCLWFWHESAAPVGTADRIEALRQIEQNGSLAQFTMARELRKWL
jgi:hypothetical protein